MPRPRPRRRNTFLRRLVLHQWLLGLFGVERFDRLAEHLRDESLEGLDEDNVHRFHRALCLHLPGERRPALPDEVLLEHDQAIVAVTRPLERATHHPWRAPDRLEVLPVPRPALHRDLPRPLVPGTRGRCSRR